jgi:hypothetical protein
MQTIELIFTWGIPLLVIYALYQSKKEMIHINSIFKQLAKRDQGTITRSPLRLPAFEHSSSGF